MQKYLVFILACSGLLSSAYAENSAINAVNNEAFIDLVLGQQNFDYSNSPSNHSLNLGDMNGDSVFGTKLGVTKTFGPLYTQLTTDLINNDLSYNTAHLSGAHYFALQIAGRLGWTFTTSLTTTLTPYLTLGYNQSQIDTGGTSNLALTNNIYALNFYPNFTANGNTQIIQSGFIGLGLLGQWAATPAWVLSIDASFGESFNPWMRSNVAGVYSDSGQNVPTVINQEARLANQPFWQIGLGSDYALTSALHGLFNINYAEESLGGGTTSPNAYFEYPSLDEYSLFYTLGLAYHFGGLNWGKSELGESGEALPPAPLYAANNQAGLNIGQLYQNYGETSNGQSHYADRQAGGVPDFGIDLSKTFGPIYTQVSLNIGTGTTNYIGALNQSGVGFNTSTRNTFTNFSGRLGYQLFPSPNHSVALTPYLTGGYYRWLRDVAGSPYNDVLLDAHAETYSNGWYGLGMLGQWAVTQRWVLSAFGEMGHTFDAQMFTWNTTTFDPALPVNFTQENTYHLGARNYYQIGFGSDDRFSGNWHFLANFSYFHFSYGQSQNMPYSITFNQGGANETTSGSSDEPNSTTREVLSTVGLAYSF